MAEQKKECVSGLVEAIVYRNDKNDYTVLELNC